MSDSKGKIIDIKMYRDKKAEENVLVRGRTPLYASHINTSNHDAESTPDFATRIARIRKSLEKINDLVSDLKRLNTDKKPPSV